MKLLLAPLMFIALNVNAQEHDHSKMDHSKMQHAPKPAGILKEPIPEVTDADRAAAFPEVHAHHMHGTGIYGQVLFDRFEINDDDAFAWEARSWIGGDVQKLVVSSEGTLKKGRAEHANVEVLYSRGVRAWWDVVGGVKQDFGNERNRTWAAVGVHGMAPLKFEVSATGYVSNGSRTAAVFEGEYSTLLTNRLIVQWRSEATFYGKADPVNQLGSGLSSVSAGARMRYEFTRQFAPYIGVEHERMFGGTADYARSNHGRASDTSVVAGIRWWF